MSQKGSQYERDTCGVLSKWWTQDLKEPLDDVFWRSEGSGGRAKRRGRKGKDTFGSHSDIKAVNPIGIPLIDLITIELKRGYSKFTVADILDAYKNAAQQQWEIWLQQTWESHHQAGSYAWMLVQQRDRRDAICFIPLHLYSSLFKMHCFDKSPLPLISIAANFRIVEEKKRRKVKENIVAMKFRQFLKCVHPNHILDLATRV